jgi:hypothetical protein
MTASTKLASAIVAALTLFGCTAQAAPRDFLFLGSDDPATVRALIERPDIGGVQIVYSWKTLEPDKDRYDFSAIERDLAFVSARHKQLFIQIQDRFFQPQARAIPAYLLSDPVYGGGLARQSDNPGENQPVGGGWVAEQWNPAVRDRFQHLIAALAKQFDGRVMGVNLPETSADLDIPRDRTGFTCDGYFAATLDNLRFARRAFARSYVVQYVNFWPCEWGDDHHYMSRLFALAASERIGLGGPDIAPDQRAQTHNSYPFFHQYKHRLPLVAMAVQEPTLTYLNPTTHAPFTRAEFTAYADQYLGADIIFWSVRAPWLRGR